MFERFIKGSPITVMTRALFEHALSPKDVDALFDATAESQYTQNLLFSMTAELMALVVCRSRPSIHSAYQTRKKEIGVSIQAVYDKLCGIEPSVSQAFVRHVSGRTTALVRSMRGERPALLPGYRVKILDGNHLAATEHRIAELRNKSGGPLPGFGLVVLDPALQQVIDFFPCEDGHAQERSLTAEFLGRVEPGDVWIDDRNFCTSGFLFGIAQRDAFFVTREHRINVPWEPAGERTQRGKVDECEVWEQAVLLRDAAGRTTPARRISVKLKKATRDGDREVHILTNLPRSVPAGKVAKLYRARWGIETAFQELERTLDGEINTLGYPKAALFAFANALVAYNLYSAVKAALRAVHGVEKVENEVSGYYIAVEVTAVRGGMLLAIEPEEWKQFATASTGEFGRFLIRVARNIDMDTIKRHPRGPKKPQPKRILDKRHPHISTARLLALRKPKRKKAP
jgi:IS4 transposase